MINFSKIRKSLRLCALLLSFFVTFSEAIAYAKSFPADSRTRLNIKVSKMGLNRISNPPYKIAQVTGDDNAFKLKYDEDGDNIYLMPMREVGQKIEISLKNNAGFVQDIELEVANIGGQTIVIDGIGVKKTTLQEQKQNLQSMLKAMKAGRADKFYVQNIKRPFYSAGNPGLEIVQTKIYKWENLGGSVFIVSNKTRKPQNFDLSAFVKDFEKVLTYVVSNIELKPKESVYAFVIQEIKESN
jgi:hypothetical protein